MLSYFHTLDHRVSFLCRLNVCGESEGLWNVRIKNLDILGKSRNQRMLSLLFHYNSNSVKKEATDEGHLSEADVTICHRVLDYGEGI